LLNALSSAQYSRLSGLLDESLELPLSAREAWLDQLARDEPALAGVLRDLFASREACEAEDFLGSPGPLADDLAALVPSDVGLVGKQFGAYRVLSLLGHGGMGSVWLAERVDGLFARRVALKLVHPALVGRVITERFAREREILAGLNHPNIARLFDAGLSADGHPFLALEYIAGKSLTAYCDDHLLPVRERLQLFLQVLSAVQYAHAHLVIHRDLKPSNILVTEARQVHLLDFGIAKLLTEGKARETELTQLGGRAMTPDYAAPEVIAGLPISTAADIYSLGVMLYELLTGERPYRLSRESRGALEEAILAADPVPAGRLTLTDTAAHARATTLKKLARTLRGDLGTIVMKALKKAPAGRYASAGAFAEDIERFLRGDIVLAQRDSLGYRMLKFASRHRVGIAVASLLMLTLAIGLAATTYEAQVAAVQRDAALQAQLQSLTQTAAARFGNADVPGALGIILEVLPHRADRRSYTPGALSVFQRARAVDAQILALTGHSNRVRSAVFSPDGSRIVTASWDKTARIWDTALGVELGRLVGHTDRVWFAAFSYDGRRIVTASHDKTARIWDAATGEQLRLLSGHTDRVTSAAFSPDGRHVVTSSYDRTVRIWDADTGQQIRSMVGHTDLAMSAAYSPDGRRIVTASHDKTARIWDAATGRELLQLNGHTDWVSSAAYSPDGMLVVTASHDKTAGIWDAATGRLVRLLSGHTDRLLSSAFSPDGRRIATASFDKTARLWDAATGRELTRLVGHLGEVVGAALSPDGQRVVTASYDGTARLWDAAAGREILLLDAHSEPVACAAFSPDGARVITGSYDRTARIWDALSGRELVRFTGHTDQVVSAAFSPDGLRVATASPDRTARLWDAFTGQELMRFTGHTDQVVSVAFSPDGRRVVTASLDKTARVWDAVKGGEIQRLNGHTDMVETAQYSPDGLRIVTASTDKTARVWAAATGREVLVLSGHSERVESAAFSPDGTRIVTTSADKSARIWDAQSGRQLRLLTGHSDLVEIAEFSPDGRRVVTASDDKTARIWDVDTGRELVALSGHTDRLWYAAFAPDGQRVVTASDDKTARIWDARAPALETQVAWVAAAQFDPLSNEQRFELGLPTPADVRRWDRAPPCEEAAAGPHDPDRRAAGVLAAQIAVNVAMRACAGEGDSRAAYLRGRVHMAAGEFAAARRDFERAVAQGVRAARVDLGMLLSQSPELLDVPRAMSLYEQAWVDGVTRAGFELGSIYEYGVRRAGAPHDVVLAPEAERAWTWYQRAADAGDPNALARLAERAEAEAVGAGGAVRNSLLLDALKQFTAAAERARREAWPDEVWRPWRYRRASLARLLAREGQMQEAAEAYDTVMERYAAAAPSLWRRLVDFVSASVTPRGQNRQSGPTRSREAMDDS
jgi:WD40 repeat protein/serine/threonine protein kinase